MALFGRYSDVFRLNKIYLGPNSLKDTSIFYLYEIVMYSKSHALSYYKIYRKRSVMNSVWSSVLVNQASTRSSKFSSLRSVRMPFMTIIQHVFFFSWNLILFEVFNRHHKTRSPLFNSVLLFFTLVLLFYIKFLFYNIILPFFLDRPDVLPVGL